MFQFLKQDHTVTVAYENVPVLEGMQVFFRLHNGEEVPLKLQSAEEGSLVLADDEKNYEALIYVSVTGDTFTASVKAVIHNKELFRDRKSFAPENGIVIRVSGIPGVTGLMANQQHKDWWTRPHFDKDIRNLPSRTLSLLWQTDRSYFHLLPICDKQYRTDLSGGEQGLEIRISAFQGGFDRCDTTAFVLGSGADPYALAEENVRIALEACGSVARPRSAKKYPEILDYLGWCSWDAFYHQVNAEGLLQKTQEFEQSGIPVRWVMIDDGWSDVSADKRLRTYDAEKNKFPDGLAPVIREMKQRGVGWVGVWHTIAGYWGGIDPEGELFGKTKAHLYRTNNGAWIPAPNAAAGFGFWNDWHSYLKRQGVDFVKVDSQSAVLNFMRDEAPVGEAAQAAHTALEASIGLYFGGCVINCMGMASENIWHRPSSSVSRNSDDFVPQEKHGFQEHALQNAYNSFFHGPFYWGDWDMYWTNNHDGKQNMVLRAVSGGPVYISDKVGETNAEHIWPLVYRGGRIIRCDLPGQPTADCLMVDPVQSPVPLKLWNRAGETGVVAAFHIHRDDAEVEGTFGPSDVPGLSGAKFVVYGHFGKMLFRMHAEDRIPLKLQASGAEMYTFVSEREVGVTPIGLADKLVASDAVLACRRESGKTVVRLKEGGLFAFAAPNRPSSAAVNGVKADIIENPDQPELFVIDCSKHETEICIEIFED